MSYRYIEIYKNNIVVLPDVPNFKRFDEKRICIFKISNKVNFKDVLSFKIIFNDFDYIQYDNNINSIKEINIPISLDMSKIPIDKRIEINKSEIDRNTNNIIDIKIKINFVKLINTYEFKMYNVNLKQFIDCIDIDNINYNKWYIDLYRNYVCNEEFIEQLYSLTYDELLKICKLNLNKNIHHDIFIEMRYKYPEFKEKSIDNIFDEITKNKDNLLKYIITFITLNLD
jgi:hypothetical protein